MVELVADNGHTGLAEVPGSAAVDAVLAEARDVVIGADPLNWNRLKVALSGHFKPEITQTGATCPGTSARL